MNRKMSSAKVFRVVYLTNIALIIGALLIGLIQDLAQQASGGSGTLFFVFLAAAVFVPPLALVFIAVNVWGMFVHPERRLAFVAVIAVMAVWSYIGFSTWDTMLLP